MRATVEQRVATTIARVGRLLACAALALAPQAAAAQPSPRDVFERWSSAVVQVRIEETSSGSKSTIGSGFFVDAPGLVVTNYHVISKLLHHPERYRVRILDAHGATHEARLLGIDVVHDLAVVRTDAVAPLQLRLHADRVPLAKGERLFSLGNPLDLGMSVVEGTYNGLLEHSRHERIHFTGSLNPGMSGGPALLGDGGVIGVNVATAGNQVSFLVPVAPLAALLARLASGAEPSAEALREDLRRQLLEHQRTYLGELLAAPLPTVRMGRFAAPTQLAPFFNCWGDVIEDEDDDLYEGHSHVCSTEDYVFVSDEQVFSIVELSHRQLRSEELSPSRFAALYSVWFESNHSQRAGSKDELTPFRCRTRFVENARGLPFKATFCARRYRDLAELHDVVFKAAVLGREREGLETALLLSAVELAPARALAERVLEAIAWSE